MARLKNELSAIQTDEAVFSGIKQQIQRVTIDRLTTFGNVSRTTIFKWSQRKPINPRREKELLRMLQKAQDDQQSEQDEAVETARKLLVKQ
ncbi:MULTISPECIES: hypothetical protein [unclassified Spirosoma]|uniref:hypothetical protein n=1 Tax=unclassified Spirosoma TaxID=2621999 RepID=UPI000959168D|nr:MULTISPECIES: hypothetical protein [unclassified Spirosoma]MBN8826475.1 hypothetical protein [Spirosoma sp.]OJW76432.1 MAG: hypothetical protein BGO59_23245 [Spirosoma sp. 48-14]